jgi:hypothetical protein
MSALTMKALKAHPTPPGAITLWWLGQAGFLLKSPAGKLVALDPYLSNSCKAIGDKHGFDMDRLFLDNCQPPQMLRTNLKLQGLGDRYHLLRHGEPFDYRP